MFNKLIYFLQKTWQPGHSQRLVYDCFTFFNELEMLELRFSELYGHVDKFVLAEATKTHQHAPKPLYYLDNKERFRKFHDKIIHLVVDDLPGTADPWVNEKFQRNSLMRALGGCRWYDIILVSDVDEIPHPGTIKYYRDKNLFGLRKLDQKFYYYYLNNLSSSTWRHPYIASFGYLKNRDLSKIRTGKPKKKRLLAPGGWHFSYLGGVDKIVEKIEAFAHNEFNSAEYKDKQKLQELIGRGKDLFGREKLAYQKVEIDDNFPVQVRRNLAHYKEIGWIKE